MSEIKIVSKKVLLKKYAEEVNDFLLKLWAKENKDVAGTKIITAKSLRKKMKENN